MSFVVIKGMLQWSLYEYSEF